MMTGCDDDGEHCYPGPPRCPDEVLDPLRRPEACGLEGSFSAALHADKGQACEEDGPWGGGCARQIQGGGPWRRRGAAATGRAEDLGGDGISEPACQYMSVYEIGYHICTYMIKIYCNIRTVRILYVYPYMHVLYVYVCICLYISNPVTDILTYTCIY